MLIDHAKIYVKAGNGGNGCTSTAGPKFKRGSHPDGGPGGDGGDIVIRVDLNIQTLLDFQYRQHFKAANGGHGSSNNKKGARGQDAVILVPSGTSIYDASTNLLLRDLTHSGEEVIICRGGRGGRGNKGGKPAMPGEPGEEKEVLLELKLIAEVGIIGYPNVGKSTLISAISNAKSKVAAYPFTTKEPVLGVAENNERTFVVADIPGLIEGAHAGKGLGDKFLRHIERTKLLVHMIDLSEQPDRNPVSDYKNLNKELNLYSRDLTKKPQILVANKMDLPGSREKLAKFKRAVKKKVYPLSALRREGLGELIEAVQEELDKL